EQLHVHGSEEKDHGGLVSSSSPFSSPYLLGSDLQSYPKTHPSRPAPPSPSADCCQGTLTRSFSLKCSPQATPFTIPDLLLVTPLLLLLSVPLPLFVPPFFPASFRLLLRFHPNCNASSSLV
ncbi:hypothetical protein AMTR_s00015p00003450, partial [Amborella trichopoda]